MKVKVFTEDAFTAVGLKKVLTIMRESKTPNDAFNATFPERYRGITRPNRRQTNVYFDKMHASGHVYEMEA